MPTAETVDHKVVSRLEWLDARRALLEREREMMKAQDALKQRVRELPWVKVEKAYVFDAPDGKKTLADLFNGRSQLFVKHFMMAPGQTNHCVGCFFEVDHVEGILEHLENHDISYVAVARALIEEIEVIRKRMGWHFRWVSSYNNDFNYDFNVSFKPEDMAAGRAFYNFRQGNPGIEDLSGNSVFYKDEAGQIFHTYSTFGRGGEQFLGTYAIVDVMPKGRDEQGPYRTLADWVRPKDMYGKGGMVEGTGRYHAPICACAVHK